MKSNVAITIRVPLLNADLALVGTKIMRTDGSAITREHCRRIDLYTDAKEASTARYQQSQQLRNFWVYLFQFMFPRIPSGCTIVKGCQCVHQGQTRYLEKFSEMTQKASS